jgi:threonine/homoserine/homoserine lactone efflux protein
MFKLLLQISLFLKALIIYFVTAIVSYIATIPPGPLSVYIVHTTLQKNIKIALWIALGGILGEMGYTYLAIEGVMIFDKYPNVVYWIQWGIIVLLLVAGFITFFQKDEVIKNEHVEVKGRFLSIFKGITLSLLTPALFPFWVVVLLEYKKYDFLTINTISDKILFVAGAETGTFLLVYTYAYITERKRNLIFKYLTDNRLNKLMGILYIGLAVWQLVNML